MSLYSIYQGSIDFLDKSLRFTGTTAAIVTTISHKVI